MTFGRPASIPASYVNADLPFPFLLDEASDSSVSPSPTVEQVNSNNVPFFAATV